MWTNHWNTKWQYTIISLTLAEMPGIIVTRVDLHRITMSETRD